MNTKDRDGHDRVTGEEWLVRRTGAYLPSAYEEVVKVVDAYALTEKVSPLENVLNCSSCPSVCSCPSGD